MIGVISSTSPGRHAALPDEGDEIVRSNRDEHDAACALLNGDQWSSDEIAALKKRGQPVITFNRITRAPG